MNTHPPEGHGSRHGQPLSAGERPPILIGDHPALDFVNTLAYPEGEPVEWLTDAGAIKRWQMAAGFPGAADIDPGAIVEPEDLVRRIIRLREWLRAYLLKNAGKPGRLGDQTDLSILNTVLAADSHYRQILVIDGVPQWSEERYRDPAAQLLQPLARAAGNLICETDLERVRQCEAADCTLWFFDRTKSGMRRWCTMAICGNRAKARAHRARSRVAPP